MKFNPKNNNFAAAFESGIVEIYDLRKIGTNKYIKIFFSLLKKSAHNKTILTLDWNPIEENVLVKKFYLGYWEYGQRDKDLANSQ